MKHDHWDITKCSRCLKQTKPLDEGLHEQYTELQSVVEDLLRSIEAKKSLDDGFRGMGYNILVEKASRFNGHVRKLKKIVEWEDQNEIPNPS
jgi:hypothetical protein